MPFFQEAEKVIVNGGNLVDRSSNVINVGPDTRKGEGIRMLLDSYVQYEAIHDSDSRGDLGCYPGTREEYIRYITGWGNGEWESGKRAFMMTGPAGAGKSAIARTCANKIEAAGNLGASFFFYRPSGWNNPKKFIPTIVYQLATRYPAFRDRIDAVVLADRLVLQKAMNVQFRELLVKPLQKLNTDGHGVGKDVVIVIDGLDECASDGHGVGKNAVIVVDGLDECAKADAQVQILHLIATSIDEQTTPFLWALFSRPEPPITSAFLSKFATDISWTLPLTLSGSADNDIEAYLRGSFEVIRAKHSIPTGEWPSEDDIHRLVSQSVGLFVYPVTAIRYIDGLGKGTSGLEERLRAVLEFDPKSTNRPFAALDKLYRLIMMQIPEGVLPNTLSLLLLNDIDKTFVYGSPNAARIPIYCFALCPSSAAFHVAISNLHSVLDVTMSEDGKLAELQFYHKSFQEFFRDPGRSNQYSIALPAVHQHCLKMIIRTLGNKVVTTDFTDYDGFLLTVQAFFILFVRHDVKLEENMLRQISQVDWSRFRNLNSPIHVDITSFIRKIPLDWRRSIIRPFYGGISDTLRHICAILLPERCKANAYVLGKGDKKGLIVPAEGWGYRYIFSADLPRSVLRK